MAKKYSRIIAVIMLVIAIVFIFIALNNPQASFPWSNEITYILYGVYVCLDSVYMRLSQNSQPNSDTPDMNSRKER